MTDSNSFYPYRELNTLQDRVNRLFHESFTNSEGRDESLATASFCSRRLTSTKMSAPSRAEDGTRH